LALAEAYFSLGRMDSALASLRRTLELAVRANDRELAEMVERKIDSYINESH
jgi:hypothetical protein